MNALRILTVDDEPLALRRLKLLLQTMPSVDHVGEAGSCREALAKINAQNPDVVLLDIRMRDLEGHRARHLDARRPATGILELGEGRDQGEVGADPAVETLERRQAKPGALGVEVAAAVLEPDVEGPLPKPPDAPPDGGAGRP